MAYYAMIAFWTTAIKSGIFPHWVPFQSMGYPFGMNLQSGMYYLPLWIFPIFNIPYTLQNAVRFQCLHILFGSVGMFILLKVILGNNSSRYALAGAITFQFFGGFYSNAQHVDIIRAYALAPWLFYTCTLHNQNLLRLASCNLLIPIFIYLLATGGYPGNFISSIFILSIYILLQLIFNLVSKDNQEHKIRRIVLTVITFGLVLLGISMASVHLAPAWLYKAELTRNETAASLEKMGLWFEHLPGLFLSSRTLPGEISMTSTYITLPIFFLLFFLPHQKYRKSFIHIYIIILCLSLAMVAGDKSIVWLMFSRLFPPLGLSRFPSSDYRVFIAITIIILSISSLKTILEQIEQKGNIRNYWKYTSFACLCIILGIQFGIYTKRVLPPIDSPIQQETIAQLQAPIACIITLGMITVLYRTQSSRAWFGQKQRQILIFIIILMIVGDGARVISDMLPMWFIQNSEAKYAGAMSLVNNGKLVTYSIFENLPTSRPPRKITDHYLNFSWQGYLNGTFMMQDYGGTVLKRRQTIEENQIYNEYMSKAWQPILLEKIVSPQKADSINIKDDILINILKTKTEINKNNNIVQTKYGINNIEYKIKLNREMIMLENEIYFPGWSSILIKAGETTDRGIEIKATPINGVFRGWILPSGTYTMKANYTMPYWKEFRNISIFGFMVWIVLFVKLSYIYSNKHVENK
ncbi:MAG: hypothetical protein IGS39_19570 [Calothrix sp. C42_A2020_038]|nr:hypothetical protein [Calothrix sp. C42_A2020_038]